MIYNHNLKTCDFSTKCQQSKSSLIGDPEISCDSKPNGLYRHPTTCTKFIRCQNGAVHIHDCASGTLFNPVDKNCDFPHNVNCNVDNDNRNNENETEEERWQRYWDKETEEERWQRYWDKQNPSGSRYKTTSWQDQWDQNQNSQWDQDQNKIYKMKTTGRIASWQDQWDQNQNSQWDQDQNKIYKMKTTGRIIYIPPENVTANKFTRAGIKTLSWHYQESPNIIVHHNYSKVILHQPDEPKNYNYSHSTSNINSNQKLVINDQLDEFRTTQQENQDLNQDSLRNKLKLIREQIPNPTAEDSTTRPFTNAHSGGYPPVKSEKLRLKLLVNPQEIRSAHEEIEVYKKCPSGATGQFVTELSCNQFLNCWKGRGYIQNCPPGTLFNPRTLQCDFKHKVSCVSGPRQAALTEKEALSEALQARCPQGFSGIIPHYTNCAKFINCNNGVEFVMDCAPGTLFDTKTNMCDYPHKATCADKEDNEDDVTNNKLLTIHGYNSNITYQIPARNINDHLQEFKYHNLNRQGRYDKVGINDHLGQFGDSNLVEALATAEHNQWFTQTPIYIGNVTSTSKIDFGHQNKPHHGYPKATPNETSPKCPAGASGLFPHPTICEKFLNCDHGRTFIQDCGPGTVFNPNFKVCDFPYNVDCDTKTAVADLDQTAGEIEEDTNRNYRMVAGLTEAFSMGITQSYCENKSGFWIYPQNCSRFIFCNDGQLFIGICSEDMNFNPEKADCREDIDCLSVLNQYGGGQQPDVQDLSTEYWRINTQYQYFKLVSIGNEALVLGLDNSFCQINPGFSIHPRDCSKFLLCTSTGVLLLGVCNSKTYYNPQIQSCQTTPKCDHIRQFGTQNFGRENWQANTQYQYFRLISIGNEGYALGLDRNFCQNNPGFSIHPRNCSPK
ncbi:Chitin binding Peritrophin-A domain [Popillia japonica]|uniref:Chitin binding Peritrophin-A domain n=1 Tax=Popillia japonica TaxID=7064 RepID=A0AAW1K119_POPJA